MRQASESSSYFHIPPPIAGRSPQSRTYLLGAVLGIGYVCVATFAVNFGVIQPGLDESWMYGLNQLNVSTDYVFGRDVVSNYGPLGYLVHPRAIGSNLLQASAFAIGIQVALAAACGFLAWNARRRLGFFLFLAGLFAAQILGLWEEYYYRILLGLCLLAGCLQGPLALPMCATAGILTAAFLILKFNLGITALSMLPAWVLILFLSKPGRASARLAALGISLVLSLVFVIVVFFKSLGNFSNWLALSFEIAKGYGAATSVAGPLFEALVGACLLAAFIGGALFLPGNMRIPLVLFFAPAFVAFKHGYVGYTTYASGYLTFLVAVTSILFLYATTRRDFKIATLCFLAITAAAFFKGAFLIGAPRVTTERILGYITARTGLENIKRVRYHRRVGEALQSEARSYLAEQRLPERWLSVLSASSNGVDVLPWELSFLPANGLKLHPLLVMQHHLAYTKVLDSAVARYIVSSSSPGALLLQFGGVFGRNLVLDTPETFRAILEAYEPQAADPSRNLLLALRKPESVRASNLPDLTTLSRSRMRIGEWVEVPEYPARLYVKLHIKRNLLGHLREFFWKTPPIYLRLVYSSGRLSEHRLLASTAANGVLLNAFPGSLDALYDLWQGIVYDKVARFQLAGPGFSAYEHTVELAWLTDYHPLTRYGGRRIGKSPEVVSLVPSTALHQAESFTIVVRDMNGARHPEFVSMIVSRVKDGRHACYLNFEVKYQRLWLIADKQTGAATQGVLGSHVVLESSTCLANLAESFADFRGDRLTLHLAVALKSGTAGAHSIDIAALGPDGINSHRKEFGTWHPDPASFRDHPWRFPERPPSLTIEADNMQVPRSFRLNIRVSDINGSGDLEWAQVIINDLLTGAEGCYVHYDVKSNLLFLFNEGGRGYAGLVTVGGAGVVATRYCRIEGRGSSLSRDTHSLHLAVPIWLTRKMEGKYMVFAAAADQSGLRQNWRLATVLENH